LLTKIKIAFSGDNLIRLRITYTNCPTVKSAGTRYLQPVARLDDHLWDNTNAVAA
jgi:hypothetical protein